MQLAELAEKLNRLGDLFNEDGQRLAFRLWEAADTLDELEKILDGKSYQDYAEVVRKTLEASHA